MRTNQSGNRNENISRASIALYSAVEEGNLAKINEFAAEGADINYRSPKLLPGWKKTFIGSGAGNTVLHLACWLALSTQIVERILDLGADIDCRSDRGSTPINYASYGGNFELVSLLLERGCKADESDNYKFTALHEASQGGHRKIVELLLTKGLNIHEKDVDGSTALICAAAENQVEVAECLLEMGSNVRDKDKHGNTPLMHAANGGSYALVELFLDTVDRAAKEQSGKKSCNSIVETSAFGGSSDSLSVPESTPAISEGMTSDLVVEAAKLEANSYINFTNTKGYLALHWAACKGHIDVARLLLDRGSAVDVTTSDGDTPLIIAACFGFADIVELLLNYGSNVSFKNGNDDSSLVLASWKGHVKIVELLLDRDATGSAIDGDVNANTKITALQCACQENHMEAMQLLLVRGANIHLRNITGDTALTLSQERGNVDIVAALKLWPTTMVIIMLQELILYPLLDFMSFTDLYEYIGEEKDYILEHAVAAAAAADY